MAEKNSVQSGVLKSGSISRNRFTLLKFFIIVAPLWVSVKFYSGPYHDLMQNYFSCIVYIIFWGLVIQMVFPKLREEPLLAAVFFITCAIELLHWKNPGLFNTLDVTVLDQTLIGANYSLHKIPYYGVGTFIGYFVLKASRS
ncbi:MAG: DUF2809 domain-containing protein [Desulfobacteraceae bacterium]